MALAPGGNSSNRKAGAATALGRWWCDFGRNCFIRRYTYANMIPPVLPYKDGLRLGMIEVMGDGSDWKPEGHWRCCGVAQNALD
jgi:hypothetical protein